MIASNAFPAPRAILFDWDNTLADSWAVIHAAMNTTLTAMGRPTWTMEESRSAIKASLRDRFPPLFGERWREAIDIYLAAFERRHLADLREMPAAGVTLAGLRSSGLYLAVVSNKIGRYLRAEAEHLGWTSYFGRLVGAQDAETDKPGVAPVEMALAGSGLARGADVWFVGDADIDMACAVNAGCTPILLRDRPPGADEFAAGRPLAHVPNCAGLADLVAQLRVSQAAEL